jgi:nucleotide-binding universal stress UspA family protein
VKIRRIIVGLDSVPSNRALLEAAVELAGKAEAELVGLFVENIDLLHFAGLPFAREVGFASATRRVMDVEAMERCLRALAKEAQRTLEATAAPASVRWSFRVARGSAPAELLAVARDADLVVVNIAPPGALPPLAGARVVLAGDAGQLRAALQAQEGVLVLAGADHAHIAETLRTLLSEEEPL